MYSSVFTSRLRLQQCGVIGREGGEGEVKSGMNSITNVNRVAKRRG